jgi:hypothetical protein
MPSMPIPGRALVALATVQQRPQARLAPQCRHRPGTVLPRGTVANVLIVTAHQACHIVALLVLMESNNGLPHGDPAPAVRVPLTRQLRRALRAFPIGGVRCVKTRCRISQSLRSRPGPPAPKWPSGARTSPPVSLLLARRHEADHFRRSARYAHAPRGAAARVPSRLLSSR